MSDVANIPSSKIDESSPTKQGWLDAKFEWITESIHNFFFDLGIYVDTNASRVLYLSIAFTLVCGCGWARFNTESRPEKLFTPQDSPAILDQEYARAVFPSNRRYITLYAATDEDSSGNLLTMGRDPIYDMFSVYEAMTAGEVGTSPDKLADLCVPNSASAPNACAVTSPLAFWNYDRATFTADANWKTTMSAASASDCCGVSPVIDVKNVMGGITRDSQNNITDVFAYRMQFTIEEKLVVTGGSQTDPRADSLEEAYTTFFETFKPVGKEKLMPYSRYSQRKAVSGTFAFDGILTFISYILITIFATWILSDPVNPVRSRAKLGPLTVLVVGMSVVASFGIVMAFGVDFNPVVNSVVFVLLGVGVDDSLVVLEHMDQEVEAGTPARLRIPNALAKAGASISLTSFTDFAAFLAGATTIIPSLRYFCIFAAVAIFVDFALQLTCFIAFLRQDEQRIEEGRRACTCCCLGPCPCGNHPGQIATKEAAIDGTMDSSLDKCADGKAQIEMTPTNKGATAVSMEEGSEGKDTGAAGPDHGISGDNNDPNDVHDSDKYVKESIAKTFITKTLPGIVLTPYGKVGVFIVTAGIFAAAIVGITKLELDFQSSWFIPDGTDAKYASNLSQKFFAGENLPVFVYTKDVDYYGQRNNMIKLCEDLGKDKYVLDSTVSCWAKSWNDATGGAAVASASASAYYSSLNTYLGGAGAKFSGSIKWNADKSKVIAARVFAQLDKAVNAQQNIDAMISTREVAAKFPDLEAMSFSAPFVFFEGLRVVYEETVRNVIATLIVVFVVCIVFLSDIRAALLTTMSVMCVDLCLFGFIHWIGLHMNTVTSINLLLALGLTVDYSAHICHAYMHCDGATKDERVIKAYKKIGVSVFNGGCTTFVAVFALVGANSYVFMSFFRCFVLIISFGLYFGMIFLPVVLSLVGPDKVFHDDKRLAVESTVDLDVAEGGAKEAETNSQAIVPVPSH